MTRQVEEANPLKQGLKLKVVSVENCCLYGVEEANPLKQGLKQSETPFGVSDTFPA